MRPAPLFPVLGITLGAIALTAMAAPSVRALDIERESSPVLYIDGDVDRGMYAAYRITNDDAVDHPALWVAIGGWRVGSRVGLAPREDGVTFLGPLARGASATAYFYLVADRTTFFPEEHEVAAFAADPTRPDALEPALARARFTNVVERAEVAKGPRISRVDLAPLPPALGGDLVVTATGRIPAPEDTREVVYSPAARVDWPADTFELVGARLTIPGELTLDGALVWKAPYKPHVARDLTFTYTFRVGCAAGTTRVAPLVWVDPGCPRQHNDPALSEVTLAGPSNSALVLAREPVDLPLHATDPVLHRLMVKNISDHPARFDALFDALFPTDGLTADYVPGSTTIDGRPAPDPDLHAATLAWTDAFAVAPGATLELAYLATYPAHLGVYEHEAWGEVRAGAPQCGDALPSRIDTTASLADDAPAVARVALVNHPPIVPARLVWSAIHTPEIVVPDLGAGFADVDGDGLGAIEVLASPGGAARVTGETLAFRPLDPTWPAMHAIDLLVCDDFSPAACTRTRIIVALNDPPTVAHLVTPLAWQDTIVLPLARLVHDAGLLIGDDPSDGDVDGLGLVLVGPTALGPWGGMATLAADAGCGVDLAGAVTARAGGVAGDTTCYVRVCEELPIATPAVCAVATLGLHVSECLDAADCRGGLECAQGECVDRAVVDARDDTYTTATDTPLVIADPDKGVLANDLIPDGAAAYATLVPGSDPATSGRLTLAPDGTFRFVPAPGWRGALRFTYTLVVAGHGTDGAAIVIDVRGEPPTVNTRPEAADDLVDALEDTPLMLDVRANDVDPDGDPLVVTKLVLPPRHGVATLVDGDIRYAPAPDWYGDDALAYEVCDPGGLCDAARVEVMVADVNDPPLALDDRATTPEDTAVLMHVLANDRDVEGDPLTIVAVYPDKTGNLAAGRPTLLPDQTILFTPGRDRTGPLFYGYRVCDLADACSDVLARVDVVPVPDAPVAADDGFVIVPDRLTILPVLANDGDADGDALVITRVVEPPRHGRAIVLDRTLSYVSRGRGLVDSFVYEACDASDLCAEAEVTLLLGVRPGPIAVDDEVMSDGAQPVLIDVLDNDTIIGRDAVSITWASQPSNPDGPHGTVVVGDGVVLYAPDPGRPRSESFAYTACDFRGACGTARVDIVIDGVDLAPRALDELEAGVVGTPLQVFALANDLDPEGGDLVITAITQPRHGTVEVPVPELTLPGPDRVFYRPAPSFRGQDHFRLSVADPAGGSAESIVVVHVMPRLDRAPLAQDDRAHVRMAPAGGVLGYTTELYVRTNDFDADNDPMTIVVAVMPAHGTVRLSERGNPLYTPVPGYFGPDRFSYTIDDGHGARATAVVDLVVGDRDEDGLSDLDETQVTFTDPNDADSDGDRLSDYDEVAAGVPRVYEPGIDTSPLDADSDDDGPADGVERMGDGPLASFAPTDPLAFDSDGDGLGDGLEVGVLRGVPGGLSDVTMRIYYGTDLTRFRADADPATRTDPSDDDSDDDGLIDGHEDLNHDGAWWGVIGATGSPGLGETDPGDADTDGDGLPDGLELGLTAPQGVDTDLAVFRPDLDPTSVTNPRDLDSDDGSVFDGAEDRNGNGRVDRGEIDPTWGVDDVPMFATGGGGSCSGGAAGPWLLGLLGLALARGRARRTGPGQEG